MIIGTAIVGLFLGIGISYLVMQDDTLSLGMRIFFSVWATVIMICGPTAMMAHLS